MCLNICIIPIYGRMVFVKMVKGFSRGRFYGQFKITLNNAIHWMRGLKRIYPIKIILADFT